MANIQKFKKDLHNGVIIFTFKKKSDGTSRQAKGTLDRRILPDSLKNWKRKTHRRIPRNSVLFYDIDKHEIRSFKDYLLQKVLKHQTYGEYSRQPNENPSDKPSESSQKQPSTSSEKS